MAASQALPAKYLDSNHLSYFSMSWRQAVSRRPKKLSNPQTKSKARTVFGPARTSQNMQLNSCQ